MLIKIKRDKPSPAIWRVVEAAETGGFYFRKFKEIYQFWIMAFWYASLNLFFSFVFENDTIIIKGNGTDVCRTTISIFFSYKFSAFRPFHLVLSIKVPVICLAETKAKIGCFYFAFILEDTIVKYSNHFYIHLFSPFFALIYCWTMA